MRRNPADESLLPTPLADSHPTSDHAKTSALIGTCSVMLLVALSLRLALVCLVRRRRQQLQHQNSPQSRKWKLLQHALDVSVYIVLWYGISIGMTLFNKWFLRVWADGGYPFATTMTCLNMLLKCLLSRVVDRCSSTKMTSLPRSVYWKLAVPIGLCTSLDIMLSNLSFLYITVTFYTVVKSGGNVWNLFFSIWLGHQRASFALVAVILLISSGIALASYGSTQFVLQGFLLVLAASIIGTLRWVLTQSLLKVMDQSSNRILAVVYYISPASAVSLLPIAILSEGRDLLQSKFTTQSELLVQSLVLIFVSGCFAFALIFVEILLVKKTSALSLGIAGSFKDVTQVVLAVVVFGDVLSPINVAGLVVATCGMLLYAFIKHSEAARPLRYSRVPTAGEEEKNRLNGGPTTVVQIDSAAPTKAATTVNGIELTRRESKDIDHDREFDHI